MRADYAFINGEVITVNPEDGVLDATAVRDDEICAMGTTEGILRLQGPEIGTCDDYDKWRGRR